MDLVTVIIRGMSTSSASVSHTFSRSMKNSEKATDRKEETAWGKVEEKNSRRVSVSLV